MKKFAYMFVTGIMALVMTACESSELDEMIERQSFVEQKEQTAGSRFVSAQFSVTLDPNYVNTWLVGCAVTLTDGTWALALEQNGTPVAARSNFWAGNVSNAYNGAYCVKGKWYPCIASDRNNGMEWGMIGTKFNIISYADADAYTNWGNDNIVTYGQHSVKLTGYYVEDDPQRQTLTFFYNGIERGSLSYANLK